MCKQNCVFFSSHEAALHVCSGGIILGNEPVLQSSIAGVSEQLCVGCRGQVCTLLFTTNTQFCLSNEAFVCLAFEHCWQPEESLFYVFLCIRSKGYVTPHEC